YACCIGASSNGALSSTAGGGSAEPFACAAPAPLPFPFLSCAAASSHQAASVGRAASSENFSSRPVCRQRLASAIIRTESRPRWRRSSSSAIVAGSASSATATASRSPSRLRVPPLIVPPLAAPGLAGRALGELLDDVVLHVLE